VIAPKYRRTNYLLHAAESLLRN